MIIALSTITKMILPRMCSSPKSPSLSFATKMPRRNTQWVCARAFFPGRSTLPESSSRRSRPIIVLRLMCLGSIRLSRWFSNASKAGCGLLRSIAIRSAPGKCPGAAREDEIGIDVKNFTEPTKQSLDVAIPQKLQAGDPPQLDHQCGQPLQRVSCLCHAHHVYQLLIPHPQNRSTSGSCRLDGSETEHRHIALPAAPSSSGAEGLRRILDQEDISTAANFHQPIHPATPAEKMGDHQHACFRPDTAF